MSIIQRLHCVAILLVILSNRYNLLENDQENTLSLQLGARLRACSSITRQAGNLRFFYDRKSSALSNFTVSEGGSITLKETEEDDSLREYSTNLTQRLLRFHRKSSFSARESSRASTVRTTVSSRRSSDGDIGKLLAYLEEQEAAELQRKRLDSKARKTSGDKSEGGDESVITRSRASRVRPTRVSDDTVIGVDELAGKVDAEGRDSFAGKDSFTGSSFAGRDSFTGRSSVAGTDREKLSASEREQLSITESGIMGSTVRISLDAEAEGNASIMPEVGVGEEGRPTEGDRYYRTSSGSIKFKTVGTIFPSGTEAERCRGSGSEAERHRWSGSEGFAEVQKYLAAENKQFLQVSTEYQQKFLNSIENWLVKLVKSSHAEGSIEAFSASITRARGDVAVKILKGLEKLGLL